MLPFSPFSFLFFRYNMSVSSSKFSGYSQLSTNSESSPLLSAESRSGTSQSLSHNYGPSSSSRDNYEAWWSVGPFLEPGITHQSAGLSMTNRVFNQQNDEELWDLSDSLAELYQDATYQRGGSINRGYNKNRKLEEAKVDVNTWLSKDTNHGFIRVYTPESDFRKSQRMPCELTTTAQKLCLMLGAPPNSLHVQLNGDIIRRLDPYDHPLVLQNEYLTSVGHTDLGRIQEEGNKEELGYMIRFYSGMYSNVINFQFNLQKVYEISISELWYVLKAILCYPCFLLEIDITYMGRSSVLSIYILYITYT